MKFEKFAQEGNEFMNKLAIKLQTPENTDHAYRMTTAVLQTLRDIISPEESMHVISQLPMFLKAMYVNGWELKVKNRPRTMNEFLVQLRSKNSSFSIDFANDETAIGKAKAVLKLLKTYLSPGETEDVISQFPEELLELWATKVDITR
jgi:uncharacterized protein (DUF2267 family)